MAGAVYIATDDLGKFDWNDVPVCAQACMLNTERGYWHKRCSRDDGTCCPETKPDGVSHTHIWGCVWRSCEKESGGAQKAAEVFMRGCASKGYPLSANFTLNVPSTIAGDHFPVQYQYKDFSAPAEVTPISGLYGGGTLLAWAIAMVAAAFSGIRPSSRKRRRQSPAPFGGHWQWVSQWVWHLRRDAELIIALALPCVAAGDIKLRWERLDFSQIFGYSDPSFVPASDGDFLAPDILTIRAAIVIINHFLISILPMIIAPLVAASFSPSPSGLVRHLVRTLLILATMIWCLTITKPLFCQASPAGYSWPGGCRMTNIVISEMASKSNMVPGVGCGNNEPPALFMGGMGLFSFIIAFGIIAAGTPTGHLLMVFLAIILLSVLIFLIWYPIVVMMGYFFDIFFGALVVPCWYLTTQGRQCSFGPSNMIAFNDLDQVFALAIGLCAGLASIWDSIAEYRGTFRGDAVPPDNAMP
ncbi:hypothetical protein B0T25DRAFT_264202 [Lasiosphaeria hispida]|uniref:Uncharacterized protein n=1 Tax=Lasiosphaeria hispida TaxID=260671 RepID=A0AAJ0MAF4_9PEZI|nr:hypothetical protein B0T25DRAFT_264202 [Lasiosphaeria hispida]